MPHEYCPINHSAICSCHWGWYFAFLSIDNWNEQYWHPYTELQILALSKLCQSDSARADRPWEAAPGTAQFQWFSLFWLLMVGPAAPQLPAAPPATPLNGKLWRVPQRPPNYHKRFSGQMPSPSLAGPDHSHLGSITHDHHDQLSHLH